MALGYRDGFVALAGVDFANLVEFYRRLLMRSPQPIIPDVYAEFQLPGLRLAVFKPKVSADFAAPSSGAMSLCLEVEDLGTAIAHATSVPGATVSPIMTASHGSEVYLFDPAGNRLILHQSAAA